MGRRMVEQLVDRDAGSVGERLEFLSRGQNFAAQPIRYCRLADAALISQLLLRRASLFEIFAESVHQRSIGDSDISSIGQTYTGLSHTHGVVKKAEIRTFWARCKEALQEAGRHGKTFQGQKIKPTQDCAARIAGVKQPSVSDWNKPGKGPELENAQRLAVALDVCVEWLYTERGSKRPGAPLEKSAEQLWEFWSRLDDAQKARLLGRAEEMASANPEESPVPFSKDSTKKDRTAKPAT